MRQSMPPAPRREADNELYDHGCELLEAAAAIRASAARPGAASAAPALLGCVEAAIAELGLAVAALEQTAAESLQPGEPVGDGRRARQVDERMHHGCANLCSALTDAQAAAKAARALVARALAGAG